jgi:hypothetical protein
MLSPTGFTLNRTLNGQAAKQQRREHDYLPSCVAIFETLLFVFIQTQDTVVLKQQMSNMCGH